MIKDDCMMFREETKKDGTPVKHCEGLRELECDNCKFFKTVEEFQKQEEYGFLRPEYQEWLASKKKRKLFDGEVKPC